MIKKIFIFTLLFYFLVLLQTSFLVHFRFFGGIVNLIFIAVILINIMQKPRDWSGLLAALSGGLFLDIFSAGFIGFYALILLASAIFVELVFKKYVSASIG